MRPFLVFSQCREKEDASSLVSLLIRALISSGEIHPHEIITSQRVTSPNTMTLRITVSTHELGWICVGGWGGSGVGGWRQENIKIHPVAQRKLNYLCYKEMNLIALERMHHMWGESMQKANCGRPDCVPCPKTFYQASVSISQPLWGLAATMLRLIPFPENFPAWWALPCSTIDHERPNSFHSRGDNIAMWFVLQSTLLWIRLRLEFIWDHIFNFIEVLMGEARLKCVQWMGHNKEKTTWEEKQLSKIIETWWNGEASKSLFSVHLCV